MSNEEFAQLLRKYHKQACSPEELRLIDHWYDRLNREVEPLLNDDERLALKQYLWHRIEERIGAALPADLPEPKSHRPNWLRRWAAVAAVAFLVGATALLVYQFQTESVSLPALATGQPSNTIEQANKTNVTQKISLPDGSKIELQPKSQIRYAVTAASPKREVWLTGSAFFQVAKDIHRPFMVYTGKVVTQVLGTSFCVNAPKNASAVEVSVRTGRVSVSRRNNPTENDSETSKRGTGVVLTPNQKVTFFAEESRWITSLVAEPRPIQTENGPVPTSFAFDESPLSEVLQKLQKEYGIDIVVAGEPLETCRFTGDISQQPLYTKLELICRSINAHYEVLGTSIVISGAGCQTE
ncbi:FecR family protein [Tellurirhabdus bombi]|uniref:FecR family protein n=1 Tax=Tellurirhabdus bombi TaxID=2907205 RepID=UPI001F251211|nr:FecR family protein [Tellurirhabdus bombi]